MAKGDYSTVSGIRGYDELRKSIHKGSGSPKVMEWLKSLRDKKDKDKDPNQQGFKVKPQPKVSPVSNTAQSEGEGEGQYARLLNKPSPNDKGEVQVVRGEGEEELQGSGILSQEKPETFQERRDRRKKEGKFYVGKYADKLKQLIRTEQASDEPAFKSNLRPMGTVQKEKQELEDKKRAETFAQNEAMAQSRDAKRSVNRIDSDKDGIPDYIDADTKPEMVDQPTEAPLGDRLNMLKDKAISKLTKIKDTIVDELTEGGYPGFPPNRLDELDDVKKQRELENIYFWMQDNPDRYPSEEVYAQSLKHIKDKLDAQKQVTSNIGTFDNPIPMGDKPKETDLPEEKDSDRETSMRKAWEDDFKKLGIGLKEFIRKVKSIPGSIPKAIQQIKDELAKKKASPEATQTDPQSPSPLDSEGTRIREGDVKPKDSRLKKIYRNTYERDDDRRRG